MSTDQCALNPDGSLKDPKDIQWFHDKDDAHPLPSSAPVQTLGRGLRNKATNRFSDAIACERLGSDEENPDTFTRPPKRKRAAHASDGSGDSAPTLPLTNSLEAPLVEEISDDEKDGAFQSDSRSESSDGSDDGPTELELISNNEVRVKLFPISSFY